MLVDFDIDTRRGAQIGIRRPLCKEGRKEGGGKAARMDVVGEWIFGLGRLESVKCEGVFRLLSCLIRMVVASFYSSGPFSLPSSNVCFIHPVSSTYFLPPLLVSPFSLSFLRSFCLFHPFSFLTICLRPILGYLSRTSTRLLMYISSLHPKPFPLGQY
ncbi:hypothetical protein BDQ17DRAFT_1367106 [Cyathus striatus]|nr:hypothetical protein BDQ17DRAFT_1367106 [Cyathus striatus]